MLYRWFLSVQLNSGYGFLFANFLRPGSDESVYEEVKDVDKLVKLLQDVTEDYNASSHAQVHYAPHMLCGVETRVQYNARVI